MAEAQPPKPTPPPITEAEIADVARAAVASHEVVAKVEAAAGVPARAEPPFQGDPAGGPAVEAKVRLWLAIPPVMFVNYQRLASFELRIQGERAVTDVTVRLASRCIDGHIESARPTLAPGVPWQWRMPLTPASDGEHELDLEIRMRSLHFLEEIYRGTVWRRVRARPQSGRDVKLAIEASSPEFGDKMAMGAAVSGGINISGPQVVVDGRHFGRDIEEMLDELDRAAQPEAVKLELVELLPAPFINHCGVEMKVVPAGGYQQGSPHDEAERDGDEMRREVRMTQPFWMGAHPVTQAQWLALMGTPGTRPGQCEGGNYPANGISWKDAMEFCRRLTERERQVGALPERFEYRLPTEAEWEYACRAGNAGPRHGEIHEIAVFKNDRQCGMQPVGTKKPNAWGLHDMLGNTYEWCLDAYAPYRYGHMENPWHPGKNADEPKVLRGGCYQDGPAFMRAAARYAVSPEKRSGRIGFRIVMGEAKEHPINGTTGIPPASA